MNYEERTKSLSEYYDKFIKPYVTEEFIQKAMLIPYLPEKTIEEHYPEIYEVLLDKNKKK